MRTFIAFSLFAATNAIVEAKACDPSDLAAIQTAVHNVCVQPDQKGQYLKVEGDLNVGGLSKLWV
jgi:hypothetical protein